MASKSRTARDTGLRHVSTATKWIAGGAAVLTGFLTVWEARSVQHAAASARTVVRQPSSTDDTGSSGYSDPGYSDPGYSDGSGNLQAPDYAPAPSYQPPVGELGRIVTAVVAAAETRALGTTARVVTHRGDPDRALELVAAELELVEQACSRFRGDSDLTRVNESPGRPVRVDRRLVQAVEVAIRAARVTDGRVDPTIGNALCLLGYDDDFAAIAEGRPARAVRARPVPGWQCIVVDRVRSTIRLPAGVRIDLGATAKAAAADQAARLVHETLGGGVLVSLGGDVSVAGAAPDGGWPVRITDDHTAPPDSPGETVSIVSGGLATSSVTVRRWAQGDEPRHHLLDPATGLPVDGPYRTVSVAAGTCVDANIATTAALVLGAGAPDWLAVRGLPARLTRHDGNVESVGRWPSGAAWAR